MTNKLEKPVSQRYVVGKGRIRRNAISDRTGYDCKLLIQNLVTDIEEKSVFAASLVMSSMNFSCAFSGTSSTLMVNGLLARANGVSSKLGKYLEISSSRIFKCSLTESIVLFIVFCSISFSSKKVDKFENM